MTKTARGWRTFADAAVGVLITTGTLTALSKALEVGDWRTTLTTLVVGSIIAVVAGIVAIATAKLGSHETPGAKALWTMAQVVVAGIVVIPLADLTGAALAGYAVAAGKLLATALGAGLQTFLRTSAEG